MGREGRLAAYPPADICIHIMQVGWPDSEGGGKIGKEEDGLIRKEFDGHDDWMD